MTYITELCRVLDIFDCAEKDVTAFKEMCYQYLEDTHWKTLMDEASEYHLRTYLAEHFAFSKDHIDGLIFKAQKYTTRATQQAMEALVHNLNTLASRAGNQVPFSSLNFGTGTTKEQRMIMHALLDATDAGLGDGETPIFPISIFKMKDGINTKEGDPNYDLFIKSCKVSAKRLFPNFNFLDSPFNLQYYHENEPNSEVAIMGALTGDSIITVLQKGNENTFINTLPKYHADTGETTQVTLSFEEFAAALKTYKPEGWVKYHGECEYMDTSSLNIFISDYISFNQHTRVKKVIHNVDICDWYTVTFGDGNTFVITPDHPLPIVGKGRTEAKDLQVGDILVHPLAGSALKLDTTNSTKPYNVVECCNLIVDRCILYHSIAMKKECTVENIYNDVLFHPDINDIKPSAKKWISLALHTALLFAQFRYNKEEDCHELIFVSKEREAILTIMSLFEYIGLTNRTVNIESTNNVARITIRLIPDIESRAHKIVSIANCTSTMDSYDVETASDTFVVNGVCSHNCRTRVMGNVDKSYEKTTGRGNISMTTINLPILAIEAHHDIDLFFEKFDTMIDLVTKVLLDRYSYERSRKCFSYPFLMGQGIYHGSKNLSCDDYVEQAIKHGTLTYGFIGLAECLVALTGKHHGESEESQELGKQIIAHLRKRADENTSKYNLNFSVIGSPAEGCTGRLLRLTREKYGVIPGVTDKEWFTNSSHIPVEYPISAYKKIRLEAPYHMYCNGGAICYVELDGDPTKNIEAFKDIILYMKTQGIGYGAINHPVDHDPICGYTGILGDHCPRCGRKSGEGINLGKLREIVGCYKHVSYGDISSQQPLRQEELEEE